MSTRPILPLKRPNSENLWFRMIVPPSLRQAVGRREVRVSLRTINLAEARLLCSVKQVEWNDHFGRLRIQLANSASADGARIVDET